MGENFGVVLMNSLSEKLVYHQIVRTERDEYCQLALNKFRYKNDVLKAVACDARRGLLKDLLNTPTQICHFPFGGDGNEEVKKKA